MSITILFNILKGISKSLREYLTIFNKATVKVIHPNQKIFVRAFQNGQRDGNFNESVVQKFVAFMEEVVTYA